MIATEYVSHPAPDATTAPIVASNSLVINPHMRTFAYDPLTSFTPVCNLVSPT